MHKMLQIEGKFRRFVRSKALTHALSGLLACATGIVGAMRYWTHPADRWLTIPLIVLSVAVFGLLLIRLRIDHQEESQASSTEPLRVTLEALRTILEDGEPSGHGLRLCVYVREGDEFVQITDYVGDSGGKTGRRFSIKSGIVGSVFRCGSPKVAFAKLPKNRQLSDFLVAEFGYTSEEAAQCRQDRRSWAAAPVGGSGEIIAAIYCDSKMADFFQKPGQFRRKVLEGAILGIAKYLGDR